MCSNPHQAGVMLGIPDRDRRRGKGRCDFANAGGDCLSVRFTHSPLPSGTIETIPVEDRFAVSGGKLEGCLLDPHGVPANQVCKQALKRMQMERPRRLRRLLGCSVGAA